VIIYREGLARGQSIVFGIQSTGECHTENVEEAKMAQGDLKRMKSAAGMTFVNLVEKLLKG